MIASPETAAPLRRIDWPAVVPVVTIDRLADAVPLAQALVAGGLPVIEVTLRTPVAAAAMAAIVREVPGAVVGAGTVRRAADMAVAVEAGAAFIVTPGTPPALAAALAEAPVPVVPGFSTVSEAMALNDLGFTTLKFFPAEAAGGVRFLEALRGPLPDIAIMPTGGIGPEKAPAWLALPQVVAVGGSWVTPRDAVAAGDFGRITALAAAAAALRTR